MPFAWESPDPNASRIGAALGDLIAGGPQQRAGVAYTEQFQKNATAADAMWKARDSRARAIAREGLSPATMEGAGYDPKIATLAANVLAAGATPNLRNLGDFANPADRLIEAERTEALKAGDVPRYNRLTALAEDKAYQPARIEDGVITPDGLGLGDEAFKVQPLPQTQATIDQREASAARTRAQIANDDEKTDAYVAHQRRAPKARASKPGVDPDTTMAWITAKANDLAKSGKSDEYVQAFIRNEAAKAGIDVAPSVEAPGDTGSVTVKPLPGRTPAKEAWSPAEVNDAIRAGRAAIKSGKLTVQQVRDRLLKQGLAHAAAQIK